MATGLILFGKNFIRIWAGKAYTNSYYIALLLIIPTCIPLIQSLGVSILQAKNKHKFRSVLLVCISVFNVIISVPLTKLYGGIGAAKAAGNYSAQFYPTKLAQEAGFNQVIWTDSTHTHLEESGTMNVFFRINNTLFTAPTSDRILDGVTRKSLIAIGEHLGFEFKIEPVKVDFIVEAAKNGTLKEIFGAGTAAVVNQIEGFQYKEDYYQLPVVADEDSYALQLKEALTKLQNKLADDPFNWTVKI